MVNVGKYISPMDPVGKGGIPMGKEEIPISHDWSMGRNGIFTYMNGWFFMGSMYR